MTDLNYTLEKPLPANLDAERAILGAVILDNETLEQAVHVLNVDDFFSPSHRAIYRAMLSLWEQKLEINPITLTETLARQGDLDRVGGAAYIASLFDGVPRFSRIESYVHSVLDNSRRRQIITLGNAMVAQGLDAEQTVDEQLRFAEEGLLAASEGRGESHWSPLGAVAFDVILETEKRAESGRMILDFATGFGDLDYLTMGLERQTMVVLGAAPGMGKTAFGLSVTRQMCECLENRDEQGRPPVIAWFSMEMPKKQQAQRFLASVARVDMHRMRSAYLSTEEWRRMAAASEQIAQWRVHFDDRAGLSVRKMREAIRQLRQQEGRVDVVFVDYIQLADGERKKGESREQEVATISRGLTQLAKDYNLTVIALSQLNRDLEKRPNKRPMLSDFRDSGQIAQDAYLLLGLYRDQVYNANTEKQNIAEVIVLKQRNGALATVELVFLPQIMRFEDIWKGTEPAEAQ